MIFNKAFELDKINALYKSFSVNNIKEAVNAARTLNFKGFAITMPYKKEILKYVDVISDDAIAIGAANTVINDNGILKAYNTDFISAKEVLSENLKYNNLVILGNGGYAASIRYAAKKLKLHYGTICREKWADIKNIKNSIVYNCTPVSDIVVDDSNFYIDSIVSTKMGKRLALIQAKYQYKLYTGLDFPNNI
jgi:shikimate 5-dehydrogenase